MNLIIKNHIYFYTIFVLLFVINSNICFGEEKTDFKTFYITGTAAIVDEDNSKAKDQAIESALTLSAEAGIAKLMPVEQRVNSFQQINEIISIHAKDFIQNYQVLAEAKYKNSYKVLLKTSVMLKKIEDMLIANNIITGQNSLPKILLCIAEQNINDIEFQYWWKNKKGHYESNAEKGIISVLEAQGFNIADHKALSNMLNAQFENIETDIDHNIAINIAKLLDADIVIKGRSIGQKTSNIMENEMKTFKGSIALELFDVNSGKKIGSINKEELILHKEQIPGANKALFQVGIASGKKIAQLIQKNWKNKEEKYNAIDIIVTGKDYLGNLVKLRRKIAQMDGVKNIITKEMQASMTLLAVDFQGAAKKLADNLMVQNFESFSIKISEVLESSLKIELENINNAQNQEPFKQTDLPN